MCTLYVSSYFFLPNFRMLLSLGDATTWHEPKYIYSSDRRVQVPNRLVPNSDIFKKGNNNHLASGSKVVD